jgi:hypothetical protein
MRFSFPRAIVFKEWRMIRFYLALGVLICSLGPLLACMMTLPNLQANRMSNMPQFLVVDNIMGINMPGLGYLLILFGAGLACVSLAELFQTTSLQLASEPIRVQPLLRTKFCLGCGVVILSQTVTSMWVWAVLCSQHIVDLLIFCVGSWLIHTIFELTFFAVTFALLLIVRPLLFGILLMLALLVAPLYAAELFIGNWRNYLPDGSFTDTTPTWGLRAYNAICDLSPYGIIHAGGETMLHSSLLFTLHTLEPLIWVILAFFVIWWVGNHRISVVEEMRTRTRACIRTSGATLPIWRNWHIGAIVRALSTLCAAIIVEHYVLHTQIARTTTKIVILLFLWLCCHLLARAVISYQTAESMNRSNRRALSHLRRRMWR